MQFRFFIFLSLFTFALTGRGDDGDLIARHEIENHIRQHAALQELSLSLYRALIGEVPTPTGRLSNSQAAPNVDSNLIALPMSENARRAISTEVQKIKSTGNEEADRAMGDLVVQAQKIAAQAYLHYLLHEANSPADGSATFNSVTRFLDRLQDLDDGVFHKLNQKFIVNWSLQQYEHELRRTMKAAMESGLSLQGKFKVAHFKESLNLIDPQTRKKAWEISSEPKKFKSLFYGVQEKVQTELGREYLPEYLPAFSQNDFPLALSYIDRSLREMTLVATVVNWCLANARHSHDLTELFKNELWDATFVRYQSRALEDPKANPFNEGKLEEDTEAELFFSQVFTATLLKAKQEFQTSTAAFLIRVMFQLLKDQGTMAPFQMETLLRHIELHLNGDGADLAGLYQALRFLERRLATEPPKAFVVSAEHFRERIMYLQEEIYIRERGWFPPSPKALREAFQILRLEAERRTQGGESSLPAIEVSATRRFVHDIPTEMAISLKEMLQANDRALLDATASQAITTCYQALADAWQKASEVQEP